MENKAEIAIISGTGIVPFELLENKKEVEIETKYGKPSDSITIGEFGGKKIAFLPRHGLKHTIQPSKINYRANIMALKELGVKRIIAPSAVGSLQDNIKPGDFVLTDQFIDMTKKRETSFFDEDRVCHISIAEPFCNDLRKLTNSVLNDMEVRFHEKGTYLCIEGPRFSTKAESVLFRSWGASVIGMTLIPEAVLAKEAELCYLPISMVTDYDTFKDEETVNIDSIIETVKKNNDKVKKIIIELIKKIPEKRECSCSRSLENAFI